MFRFYNIIAVIVLELTADGGGNIDLEIIGKTLYGIITNPIILGIVAGMIFHLKIPQTVILKTITILQILQRQWVLWQWVLLLI